MNPPVMIYQLFGGDIVASAFVDNGIGVYVATFGLFTVKAKMNTKTGKYVLQNSVDSEEVLCDSTKSVVGDVTVIPDGEVIRLIRDGADVCVISFWDCVITCNDSVTVRQIMYSILLYMVNADFVKI